MARANGAAGGGRSRAEARQAAARVLRIEPGDPDPAYQQLQQQVRNAVADGVLAPGDLLPSVRDLARRLDISPNTVARAYVELGREGVLVARAGGGSVIAPTDATDRGALTRSRQERLTSLARQVVVRSLALGLPPADVLDAVSAEFAARGRPARISAGEVLGR